MKKVLMLAAAALVGVSSAVAEGGQAITWTETLTPATTLQNEGIYLMYDASKILTNGDTGRRAFRKVAADSNVISGANLSKDADVASYAEYAWQVVQGDEEGTWKFRHVGTDRYIQVVDGEKKPLQVVSADAESGNFVLTLNEEHQAFKVKSSLNGQYWDGLDNLNMCTWAAGDDNAAHWYQFFPVTEDMLSATGDVTFNLTANDGSVVYTQTVNGLVMNQEYSLSDFPFYVKQPVVFTPSEDALTVNLELEEGYNFFKFVNARHRNRWAVTNDAGMTTTTGEFANGEWYLEIPEGDYFKIYSPSNDTWFGEIANSANPTPRADADNAQLYRCATHANGAEMIYNATGSNTNVSMNIRDDNNRNTNVAGWTGSDRGSWWFMVYDSDVFATNKALFYGDVTGELPANFQPQEFQASLNAKLTEAHAVYEKIGGLTENSIENIEELRANLLGAIATSESARYGRDNLQQIMEALTAAVDAVPEVTENEAAWSQIKLKGDILVDGGFVIGTHAEEWAAAVAGVSHPVTAEDIEALTNAYDALCYQVGGVSVNIRPYLAAQSHKYICADNASQPTRSTADTSRAWTLIRNSADNGFYIYNEYTGRYMKHAATGGNNPAMGLVTDRAEASSYKLDVYKTKEQAIAIICVDEGIAANRTYLHSNTADVVQCWQAGDASSFYVSRIADLTAAREHFNGVNDFAGEYSAAFVGKTEGNGYGQYTYTGEGNIADLQAAYTTATTLAADDNADPDELRAAADEYRAAWLANQDRTCTLNVPAPGDLVRLKYANPDGSNVKYASNVNQSNGRLNMETAGNLSNTVWYIDADNRLVSFSTGLVLGDFSTANKNNNRWATVLSTAAETSQTGVIITLSDRIAERFTVQASAGRYIYGANATVDCGGATSGDGYHWIFERVEWLPIPLAGESDYATVYAPVDLDFNPYGEARSRAIAHRGEIQGAELKCAVHGTNDGTYLPANTPALLKANEYENGHVYARVIYPETPAADAQTLYADAEESTEETQEPAAGENHLNSGFLATAKQDGVNYYVLSPTAEAFESHTGDYVPGFAAHLAVTEDPQTSYAIVNATVSIDEVDADNAPANATGIYDLQGRKLSAPVKGINIINGKKVLVVK